MRPLLQALSNQVVAPAQQIGQQRPQGVGIPRPLPAQIRFGPVAPGLAQNSPFSGARVAAPGSPLRPTPAASFTSPGQTASGPAASSLAPFMQTPQGGSATLPVPGAGFGTGGVAPSPYRPPPPTPSSLSTQTAQANSSLSGGFGGPTLPGTDPFNIAPTGYWGSLGTPNMGSAYGMTPGSLSTLLSALATSGTKPNMSRMV